jgi:hypothetical protein
VSGGILRCCALASVCVLVGCGHPGDPDPLVGTRPALERRVGGTCTARDASGRRWRCRLAGGPGFGPVDVDVDGRGAWHGTASRPYTEAGQAATGGAPTIQYSGESVRETSGCCVPIR